MAKTTRDLAVSARLPWFLLLYAAVVGGGFTFLASSVAGVGGLSWLFLFWVAIIVVTDAVPVPLPGGGFITPSSALDYAGILVLGPVPTALAECAATLVVGLSTRRPLHKTLWNAAAFSGTVLVAGRVYEILSGHPGAALRLPGDIPALLAMAVVYHTLNTGLVSLVIGLAEGRRPWQVWQVNYVWTTLHMAAALPLGVAIAAAFEFLGIWGVLLFVAPLLLARYTFQLYREARRDLIEFAGTLAGIIDEFDPTTCRHSERVSRYSGLLAREMGLSEREAEHVETCGLLHDIGKIAVSQRDIVQKPGPLNEEERARVALHADLGAEILEKVAAFREMAPIVRLHHERMDGRGYHRLLPEDVPVSARIVTVADAFDAMTSDRVYRPTLTLEDAVAELDRHAGRQFDPNVVRALHRLLERGEIHVGAEDRPAERVRHAEPGYASAGIL